LPPLKKTSFVSDRGQDLLMRFGTTDTKCPGLGGEDYRGPP
jgi:hypothetical protein